MEAVRSQDVAINDLPWIIDYKPERCTMCGSCVATCSFKAIHVEMRRQSLTVSEEAQPVPKHTHAAHPVIRQTRSQIGRAHV